MPVPVALRMKRDAEAQKWSLVPFSRFLTDTVRIKGIVALGGKMIACFLVDHKFTD